MKILTLEHAEYLMKINDGNLNLSYTDVQTLPDNLTVGGGLDLRNTQIQTLPDNLTVCGWLDLSGTQIQTLPDNLTVGGGLCLRNTQIQTLPDNLTVGGWLDLSGSRIKNKEKELQKVKTIKNGDYVAGKYLFVDNILTQVKNKKTVGQYTVYVGKIKGRNVVYDGVHYAHCDKIRDGIADLLFKTAADRGAEQYKNLSLDTELTVSEAVTMYRIITGACRAGSEQFVNSLRDLKEKYTIRECIELTKGQYNAEKFAEFFGMD